MCAGISELYESYAWPAAGAHTDADTPPRLPHRTFHPLHRVLL